MFILFKRIMGVFFWIIRKGGEVWIKIGMEWINKDGSRRIDEILKNKNYDW